MIINSDQMKSKENILKLKPLVYVETTIPSFHGTQRKGADMVAMRYWTREWWAKRMYYELVTGPSVLEELSRGKYKNQKEALKLMEGITVLEVTEEIAAIVETYIKSLLMPKDVRGDALHLAMASYYGCQYLLTWNCEHLANANKYEHIRHANTLLGLNVPILTTPYELMYRMEDPQ